MSNIVVITKNLFLQSQVCLTEIGLIADNGFLTNITSEYGTTLTIDVIVGSCKFIVSNNNFYILPNSLGTIVLHIANPQATNYVSLYCIPNRLLPNQTALISLIYKYLPPNCYTTDPKSTDYTKNYGSAAVVNELYNSPIFPSYTSYLDSIFPPFAFDTRWEQELNTSFPWTDSFNYQLVIQTVRNIFLIDTNIFNMSLLISQYIYARVGVNLFVFIDNIRQNLDAYWILGVPPSSDLGITTVLGLDLINSKEIYIYIQATSLPPPLSVKELYDFCKKILPVDVKIQIFFNPDFATAFGFIIDIGDTYLLDPRLYINFAIQYDNKAVYNANALISPLNPIFLTDYFITPPSQTFAFPAPDFTLSAFGVFTYNTLNYTLDLTGNTTFLSTDPTVISITDPNTANVNNVGSAIISANLNFFPYVLPTPPNPAYVTYVVSSTGFWQLDVSTLGVDTILG